MHIEEEVKMGMLIEMIGCYVFMLPLFIIAEVMFCQYYKKKGIKVGTGFIIGWQIFALYLSAMFCVTGAGSIYNLTSPHFQFSTEKINLIPIISWGLADIFGFIMNMIMFIPFGIILPLLWKKGTSFLYTVRNGFIFSLLIELSQLTNIRATDIVDLITNTIGTAIGFGIYYALFRKLTKFQIDNQVGAKRLNNTALATSVTIFMIYFVIGGFVMGKYGYEIIAKLFLS